MMVDLVLTLMLDEYISLQNKWFMSIDVHSIDGIFNLGIVAMKRSFKAEDCLALLKKMRADSDIRLEDYVVVQTTDGASVMEEMVRLLPAEHQLWYTHVLHLAGLDVIYKKTIETRSPPEDDQDKDDKDDDIDYDDRD